MAAADAAGQYDLPGSLCKTLLWQPAYRGTYPLHSRWGQPFLHRGSGYRRDKVCNHLVLLHPTCCCMYLLSILLSCGILFLKTSLDLILYNLVDCVFQIHCCKYLHRRILGELILLGKMSLLGILCNLRNILPRICYRKCLLDKVCILMKLFDLRKIQHGTTMG